MKYRNLTYQELIVLKDDFNDFLYDHRYNRFEWRVLLDHDSSLAIDLLRKYSESTFDKVMKGINYLELRTNKMLRVMHCKRNAIVTLGIEVPLHSNIDLLDIHTLKNPELKDLKGYRCFKTIAPYQVERENEVFQLIENGAYVVDQTSFEHLSLLRQTFQN